MNTSTTETCLKLWRERILNTKRKELSPSELCTMFQNEDLQRAFFQILDRDENGAISLEEWTGCFSKLLGDSDGTMLNWFVDQFNAFNTEENKIYLTLTEFIAIVSNVEFGYRFATIISPKSRRINTLHLLTSLEIIASMSTDAKWLSWLKYQFTDAMIKSDRLNNNEMYVTLDDFMKNFHFKEPFLAQRLFNYMDKDRSGTLSLHEFINGLEVVVNGTQDQKLEFLFKVFDVDNDGCIDFDEMRMMLKCCLEESPSLDKEETIDDLTAVLFKDTDTDDSGSITIDELKSAFKRNEALYKALSVCTSIWIKPKFINKNKKTKFRRLKETIVNNRAVFIFWTFYTVVNALCMITAFWNYYGSSPFLVCARIFGNSLNFNCSLILVLVLRKHFTWIRVKGGCSFLPIDDFIEIHKKVGIVILIETIIHTVVHLINLYNVCLKDNINYWEGLFTWKLSMGFPTGIIETVLLLIILVFAMPFVRNHGFFQLFYWFHTLTIPWLLIMLLHGKKFYIWALIPGFCYAVEKILRYKKIRSDNFGDSLITEAYVLPSKVVHLVVRKPPKFRFQPGDYVFVNIPVIAKYEWHPFSISSAPEKSDFIWLHIRAVGNWTKKLYSYSQSPKFDLNNSFMERSLKRINMRARMSKAFQNESGIVNQFVHSKNLEDCMNCKNNNLAVTACKKTVSFEKIEQTTKASFKSPESGNIHKPGEIQQKPNVESKVSNPDQPNNLSDNQTSNGSIIKHKGILKVMMLENQGSIGETSSHSLNEFPTQSTPKTSQLEDSNGNINDGETNNNEELKNDGNNNEFTNDEKGNCDKMVADDKNTSCKAKCQMLNKLASPVKSSGTDEVDQAVNQNMNIANDYFKNKEQKFELIDEKKTNVEIVIDLEDGNLKSKDNYLIKYSKDEQDLDCKNDLLGYLKMYQKANRVSSRSIGLDQMWRLRVLIDGPYGTPSHHIFEAEHAVLVASGIGITPFASILQSLMHRYKRAKATCPSCGCKLCEEFLYSDEKLFVKKVDFIWITREQRSLEWFISILSQMEIEQRKNNDLFLETHLYVTSAKRQSDLRSIGLHITLDAILSQEQSNLVDGLKYRTHFGRPNWDIVMQSLIRKQKGKISVFYCGLPSLANVLQDKCQEYGLVFKKEIF